MLFGATLAFALVFSVVFLIFEVKLASLPFERWAWRWRFPSASPSYCSYLGRSS